MKTNKIKSNPSGIKQTGAIVTGKLVALLASFTMPLFLTRYLTKSDYGIYSQFLLVISFCTTFFSMGVQSNLFYFYPIATYEKRRSIISNTFILLFVFALISISLLIIPSIGRFLVGDEELFKYQSFIVAGILLTMPVNIIEPLYVVRNDYITSIIYPPLEVILRVVIIIILVLVISGLNSLFIGIIISASLSLIFAFVYSYKDFGRINSLRGLFNVKIAKEQLEYAIPFGIAVGLNAIAQKFDKLVCISYLTTSDYATYAIAFFGIPGLQQIYNSMSQVYLIKMVKEYQNNNYTGIADIYKSLVAKTYSFTIPALLIVMLYAKKIIILFFTTNYSDSVPLFQVYLFSFLFVMLGSGLILRAMDKTKYTFNSYLISSIITIPTTYILIRNFSIWGAMCGSLLSIILPKIFMFNKEIKLVNSSVSKFYPWKKFVMILLISITSLTPFILVEYYYSINVGLSIILAIIYLFIVSILELKFEVFVFEKSYVKSKIKKIFLKRR